MKKNKDSELRREIKARIRQHKSELKWSEGQKYHYLSLELAIRIDELERLVRE